MTHSNGFDGLLEWRCIGPFRGGRVVAVAGSYHDPNVFYFGACAGGVWKTSDAGTYWECVSDGFFNTAAIGALSVAPSDSHVIYAGTGETAIRIDVSHGDGVYKSTDAGRSWTHLGLKDTRFIAKIRVHPANPDLVYVAALGHAFGPNKERGVFRSTDGGRNWEQVLFKSEKAGAIDLTMDANPRILYAAVWEAYRNFWQISSGGPESGLHVSFDGGDSWTDISDRPGLPKGIKGKIGVVASPAQSGRVWALIEHQPDGGLYRSDDYGETWEQVSGNQNLISRAWYYMHLTADPQDPETVYINNLRFHKSTDGGRTFFEIATPHGDNHDLWIDPQNPQRMVQGNDGGACVSLNGGLTWSTVYNQPTSQFYHLDVDTREPYYVYGTQQDNSSLAVPSRSHMASISWADSYVAGTGESGYIAVKPDDPDIVYVGAIGSSPGGGNALQRYDHRNKQIRLVTTWPEAMRGRGAGEHKYRFAWTYPLLFSPHDTSTIYAAGNIVFKSTNEGQSWEPISPDLTHADPETLQPSGGPINRDSVGAEVYATVFAFVESPHEAGVFYAGSDDGLLHISKDGGKNWSKINPPDMPERCLVSGIEVSPHDKATVYVAATKYKLDDFKPYLFKSSDYGQSWQLITQGIAEDDFTRVIREDPGRPGLLYVGTETGLYVSFDGGANWQRFQLNLPVAPIYDMKIKHNDLVVATHGRSFWILDDLTPLHQHAEAVKTPVQLFKPRPSVRVMPKIFEGMRIAVPGKNYMTSLGVVAAYIEQPTIEGGKFRKFLDSGTNPPRGAIITYYLQDQPSEPITLSISDAAGNPVRSFQSKPLADDPSVAQNGVKKPQAKKGPFVPANAGWNRFVWDMRYESAPQIEGSDPASEMIIGGPMAVPGSYTLTLEAGGHKLSQNFEVIVEPGATATQADLQAQFDFWQQIHSKAGETVVAINQMRDLRQQLDGWSKRLEAQPNGASLAEAVRNFRARVLAVEEELLVPDLRPGWPDSMNKGVRLLEKLTTLTSVVGLGDYRPTDQSYAVYAELVPQIDQQIARFQELVETELGALNQMIAEASFPAVVLKA